MRAQTEKIVRALNPLHRLLAAELALAHHGSISSEAGYDIEARLKAGKIPAVIATASQELGIDIGSMDLVVILEAPPGIFCVRSSRGPMIESGFEKDGKKRVLWPSAA